MSLIPHHLRAKTSVFLPTVLLYLGMIWIGLYISPLPLMLSVFLPFSSHKVTFKLTGDFTNKCRVNNASKYMVGTTPPVDTP